MKWSKIALSSRFYISSRHPQSLKNPSNLICIKISVTPATLFDSQCLMGGKNLFLFTPSCHRSIVLPHPTKFSSNFFHLLELFVPLSGTFGTSQWEKWFQLMELPHASSHVWSCLWSHRSQPFLQKTLKMEW